MLRFPNGAGPCCRTTHLKVIVQKVTGMAASRIMTPQKKKQKKMYIKFSTLFFTVRKDGTYKKHDHLGTQCVELITHRHKSNGMIEHPSSMPDLSSSYRYT